MLDIGQLVIAGLGALSGATGVELVKQLRQMLTGRAGRRRDEVARAWRHADREAAYRRRLEEHAALLRRMVIEAGCLDPEEIPGWPEGPPMTGPTPAQKETT